MSKSKVCDDVGEQYQASSPLFRVLGLLSLGKNNIKSILAREVPHLQRCVHRKNGIYEELLTDLSAIVCMKQLLHVDLVMFRFCPLHGCVFPYDPTPVMRGISSSSN